MTEIENLTDRLVALLSSLPLDDQVDAYNGIKLALHDCGPFKDEPVDCVLWAKIDEVQANDYNPNAVIQKGFPTRPTTTWRPSAKHRRGAARIIPCSA